MILRDYSFCVTDIKDEKNELKAIMVNKDGIETSSYLLELQENGWIIHKNQLLNIKDYENE